MWPLRYIHQRSIRVSRQPRDTGCFSGLGERLVLLACFGSTLGIPTGAWTTWTRSEFASTAGCRCSTNAQQSGRCCCKKRFGGVAAKSCCSTGHQGSTRIAVRSTASVPVPDSSSVPRQCCSKTKSRSKTGYGKTDAARPENVLTWNPVCGCGPTDLPMLLSSVEHRICVQMTSFNTLCLPSDPFFTDEESSYGQRSRPDIPPPKWACVA